MTFASRGRVAALCCALMAAATPARADSTTYVLTPAWQKIGSAGQSLEVQNNTTAGFAVLSTATGGPPAATGGQALGPGEHRLYTLAADLYAAGTAPLVVTTGFGGAGSLPAGAATLAAQNQLDADLKAVQPRAIAANAPSLSQAGSLAAGGDTVTLVVDGMNTGLVQIGAGAWSGTVVFEASADSGATWTAVNMIPYAGGAAAGSAIAGGLWEIAVGGLTGLRVRATTAIANGPAVVVLRATNGIKSVRVGAPAGNPVPTSDAGNAGYTASTAITAGTAFSASRALWATCTAAGTTTVSMAGGGTVPWALGIGFQQQPFAATNLTAVSGCSFGGLN